jgi:hypothetical protein
MNRKAIAVAILLLWAAGVAVMIRRNSGGDINRRLTEAALRVQPATYYYSVTYRGEKIGGVTSAIDTLIAALATDEYYTGRFPSGDSLEAVTARLSSRTTRGMRLTNVSLQLMRGARRQTMSAFVQSDSTLVVVDGRSADSATPHIIALHGALLPPGLVGVALLLAERPRTGLAQTFVVFNPVTARPERREARVLMDSLFTIVDSAGRTSAGKWEPAHSDTVRAWKLGGGPSGVTVWFDAEGRVVEAEAPPGVVLTRTAFEIAFDLARNR